MRCLALAPLLLTGSWALACEEFRWHEIGPDPMDDVQSAMQVVPGGFEGDACFTSSPAPMRHGLSLSLDNALDSDYLVTVDDGTGTVFERIVYSGTVDETDAVPLSNAGYGSYRVTITVTHPTEEAYLTAQVVETRAAQTMTVSAYKVADAMKPDPTMPSRRYDDLPVQRSPDRAEAAAAAIREL